MAERADVILTGGTVLTMNSDFQVFEDGVVVVRENEILAVGSADLANRYAADEIVDCRQQVVMPGLVNAHTHVPMTLVRGLNDDLRLDVWLGYLMPLEREFVTPEFVRLGTELACAEMIRAGVTTFADMYYFEDAIAETTAAIGMRALLGQTVLIFPAPDAETYEDALVLCRRFIERWQGHSLIQPAVAPHAWYTATPELLRACADLARGFDVPLHTHIAETALEVQNARRQHNMPVVPWNEKHGILDTKLLAAHCVHLDRGEMYDLMKAGAGVAHCPSSNLKLASGFANVGQMLELGLKLGVGTDGPASNNDLDMFEEMRLAALLAKTVSNDPTVLPARQALEMATIGGARAVHLDHLTGSLEVGKRADLIMVNTSRLHNWPHFHNSRENVYSRLVYAAKSTDVAAVMVDGRWLLRDGRLLTVDQERVKSEAAEMAARIDAFVAERESSPYNKLVLLAGVQRQESFEVQIKVPLTDDQPVLATLEREKAKLEITKRSHYRQFDHYFIFERGDPDAARLRYREDEFVDEEGKVYQARSRLTLLGQAGEEELQNTVMLSRSRWLAPAEQSLRFYREYFDSAREIKVHKERRRWRILYEGTDFAINLDKVLKPEMPGYFLEIKSRTWSRSDAERKADLIANLLDLFGLDPDRAVRREYDALALAYDEEEATVDR
ncbi:MAG: amidohydrolase [Candidatus Promineifilaceae bacterium]|nr:amidohydrolase [Candidatus Promineifilaceae bacterium]